MIGSPELVFLGMSQTETYSQMLGHTPVQNEAGNLVCIKVDLGAHCLNALERAL